MRWTLEAEARLKELYNLGMSDRKIGAELGASKNSVAIRRHKMGLKRMDQPLYLRDIPHKHAGRRKKRTRQLYTPQEIVFIENSLMSKKSVGWIGRRLKRSAKAVESFIWRHRYEKRKLSSATINATRQELNPAIVELSGDKIVPILASLLKQGTPLVLRDR